MLSLVTEVEERRFECSTVIRGNWVGEEFEMWGACKSGKGLSTIEGSFDFTLREMGITELF